MGHGGVLVRDATPPALAFDAPVELELELPDGASVVTTGKVLQVLAGLGVAVTIDPAVAGELREHLDKPAEATPAATTQTTAQKIQMALHGNRDQRNAILRDTNRTLHAYVLKNPQINLDDILAMAKNTQLAPDVYKQIAQRKEWFQHHQVALALVRNPKTPPDIAVRALDFIPNDALRQFAKGIGALPHVATAARKKVIGK